MPQTAEARKSEQRPRFQNESCHWTRARKKRARAAVEATQARTAAKTTVTAE
jgi:hypothetical protein